MTTLLVVPNPNEIRLALRAQRQPMLPHERMLAQLEQEQSSAEEAEEEIAVSENTETTPVETPAPVAQAVPATVPQAAPASVPEVREAVSVPRAVPPVQVAMANPTASLGLAPTREEAPVSAAPAPAMVPETTAVSAPAMALAVPSAPTVPTAVQAPASAPAAVPPLWIAGETKSTPVPLPPQAAAANPTPVLAIPVPDPIQQTAQAQSPTTVKSSVFPEAEGLSTHNHGANSRKLMSSEGIDIRPGERPATWSYRFEDAPIASVLNVLAEHSGSTIILDPNVAGDFSGQFTDADPMQVLAMVIKSRQYTVSRRGTYLLIGTRESRPVSR